MQNIVGGDLGFVQSKFVARSAYLKYPSIVKRRSEVVVDMEDSEGYLITTQDATWNVGSKGTYDFTAERMSRDTDLPKLLTAFGLLHEKTGATYIDMLVSGLPVYEFNNYRQQFADALQGDFHFGFGKKKIHTKVIKSLIIPQSAGAFYDFALDDHGMVKEDEPILQENVMVLDFGGRTTDGCIMEQSKYSQDSFSIFHGVWEAHSELRKLVARKYHYMMQPHEVDNAMRTKALSLGGTKHYIHDLIKQAIETAFPAIRDELTIHVPDFRRFSAILLAGGGAYIYADLIREVVGIPVIILPEAEYANASGYRKYGMLLTSEGAV